MKLWCEFCGSWVKVGRGPAQAGAFGGRARQFHRGEQGTVVWNPAHMISLEKERVEYHPVVLFPGEG